MSLKLTWHKRATEEEKAALEERLRFEMINSRLDKLENLIRRVSQPTDAIQSTAPPVAPDGFSSRRRLAPSNLTPNGRFPAATSARPSLTTAYLASLAKSPSRTLLRTVQPPTSKERPVPTQAVGQHRPPPMLPEAVGLFEAFDAER